MARSKIFDDGDGHFGYGLLLQTSIVDQLITQHNEHADALDALELGGAGSAELIDVTSDAYGAEGDGVTDDSAAIELAAAAAVSEGKHLFFPPGEYLVSAVVEIPSADVMTLVGQDAVIRFASTVRNCFEFAADSSAVVIRDLTFIGDEDDDYNTNFGTAIYLASSATDVDIDGCTFRECRPVQSVSSGSTTGRFSFTRNRVFEAPNAISTSQYSIITGNWFVNDAVVDTRSHAVYIFGPAEGCIISNNVFKNIASEDVQIRAGSARYNQKRSFIIQGNLFENSGTYSIWVGSDDTTFSGGFNISGNHFKNVVSTLNVQGASNVVVTGNSAEWDWEYPHIYTGFNSAIVVQHGGVTLGGHMSPTRNVRVENNLLTQRHPWFRTVDFTALPQAGDSITIDGEVYTWQVGAESAPGEVQIQGTIPDCISRLADEIRGNGWSLKAQNPALRDNADCFFNTYTTSGAVNTRMVIVSYKDFTASSTGGRMDVSVSVDVDTVEGSTPGFKSVPSAIVTTCAEHVVVANNTITDFKSYGIAATACVAPRIVNNDLFGAAIYGDGNTEWLYEGNNFVRTPTSDERDLLGFRLLSNKDGFGVERNNGLTVEQEYASRELNGSCGVTPVSDGKARTFLYYGYEQYNTLVPSEPHSLPFRWADGDLVQLWDGITTHNFTFKRDTPGAGEFNTIATLKTLIDATGTVTADYADFVDAGSTPDPERMLLLTAVSTGAGGNDYAIWVTTKSKTCGRILRNWNAAEDMARFKGGGTGPTGSTVTAVFTPLASALAPLHVRGIDSDSNDLTPVAYVADVVPGVCYLVTHAASVTGNEKFWWQVGAQ